MGEKRGKEEEKGKNCAQMHPGASLF